MIQIPGYRILSQIGEGGMGAVHRARQLALDREVALKVLRADVVSDELAERFRREGVLQVGLSHPGLVKVYDVGETADGRRWIAMELVEGRTLQQYLEATPRLPPDFALPLMRQLAEAVAYLHERGVLHRDIKPANILISNSGQVKLADFGVARRAGQTVLTQAGGIVGTIVYMAPELFDEAEPTPAADVYACGLVLHEMLAGRSPWTAGNFADLIGEIARGSIPKLEVSPAIAALVEQCVAKRPEMRPPAARLAERLDEICARAGAGAQTLALRAQTLMVDLRGGRPAPPPVATTVIRRPPVRRAPSILAGALLGGVLLGPLFIRPRPEPRPAPTPAPVSPTVRATPRPAPARSETPPAPTPPPTPDPPFLSPPAESEEVERLAKYQKPGAALDALVPYLGATSPAAAKLASEHVFQLLEAVKPPRAKQVAALVLATPDRLATRLFTIAAHEGLARVLAPELTAVPGADPLVRVAALRVQLSGRPDVTDGRPMVELLKKPLPPRVVMDAAAALASGAGFDEPFLEAVVRSAAAFRDDRLWEVLELADDAVSGRVCASLIGREPALRQIALEWLARLGPRAAGHFAAIASALGKGPPPTLVELDALELMGPAPGVGAALRGRLPELEGLVAGRALLALAALDPAGWRPVSFDDLLTQGCVRAACAMATTTEAASIDELKKEIGRDRLLGFTRARYAGKRTEGVEELLRAGLVSTRQRPRAYAAHALLSTPGDRKAADELVRLLESEPMLELRAMRWLAVDAGQAPVQAALVEGFKSLTPRVRRWCAEALAGAPALSPDAKAALLAAVRSPDARLRKRAAETLKRGAATAPPGDRAR